MRPEIRRTVVPAALLALASMACQSDVKPVGDVLAHDSTLALEVYGARPDSVQVVDADLELFDTAIVAARVSPEEASPTRSPAAVEAAPTRVSAAAPVRSAPARRVASTTRTNPPRATATTASNTRTRAVATTSRTSRTSNVAPVEAAPSRAWLVLPVGTQFDFESERQICTTDGENFVATLAEPVIRAGGTIVPAGATARGEIVANENANSGVAMRVQWLTFNGRAYAVNTRVTDVDTSRARQRASDGSRARCIPRGGSIVAELTQPLRVLLTSE